MEATVLGKSIIVPSVKEIAKDGNLVTVPDRYIRYNSDTPKSPTESATPDDEVDNDLELPIIDMECLINEDVEELNKLHLACQHWGFFQIINHGVSSTLVENFKRETQSFFNLPIEEKKKYWQKSNEIEGYGQAFVVSEEQKLDWGDRFYLTTYPLRQRKPHLFPFLPSPFRDTLENYSSETRKLAKKILESMSKTLGVESLGNVFEEGQQSIRMNCYPACPEPDKVIGLTPHSDAIALTILLQVNDTDGLHILKNAKWLPVKPLSHAFVVNIGDILEIVSNGIYKSVMHRAVVNASKERLSVAAFYAPSLLKEIGPMPELITSETPEKFRRINMVDYRKGYYSRPLDGKAYLDAMRIDS